MRTVVTGAAGFIGSHLCDRLLDEGHTVVGIDCFRDFYPRSIKEQNLAVARTSPRFSFSELDLVEEDARWALEGADVVFHLAARSGLGTSRAAHFGEYVRDNMLATQRLLEALVQVPAARLVFAGSSSVYGEAEGLPTREAAIPRPLSSYGVTKLAAESLVHLYGRNMGLPVTVLRYFTVYGPRQRPDMAISRFALALIEGRAVEISGDGVQTRDFTYVDDVIEATLRAATADVVGEVINIGGGSRSTINAVLDTLEEISGRRVFRTQLPASRADQRHSCASINVARRRLGWEPRVALRVGLARQWDWLEGQQRPMTDLSLAAIAM